jgi:hypothetical protein
MQDVATIRVKFEALRPYLDERRHRLWAAAEAMALGHGGITVVAAATGLQRATIRVGVRELQSSPSTRPTQHLQRVGQHLAGARKYHHRHAPRDERRRADYSVTIHGYPSLL